ncbi:MAG: hypothetical protein ACD_79C00182G0001 [uncultured bacterium]|nr:MAG: hypothetical protein ACD_79C00182G0001 [uncultured bacterium]
MNFKKNYKGYEITVDDIEIYTEQNGYIKIPQKFRISKYGQSGRVVIEQWDKIKNVEDAHKLIDEITSNQKSGIVIRTSKYGSICT